MLRSFYPILLLIPFLIGIPAHCRALTAPSAETLQEVNFNLYSARRPANDMPLTDMAGRTISLDSLKGKVVILNFWRIDCRPCAAEKPLLEKLYRSYGKRGLEIVAVNLSDSPDRIKDYVDHGGYSFTFAHDPHNRLSLRRHQLPSGMATSFVVNADAEAIYEITGVPTSYLIDRDGRLVGHSIGLTHWERGALRALLESLLGPRTLSARKPQFYTPRAVIQTRARPQEPQPAEPLDGWQGGASETPAQAGKVILAQHPLPLEGGAPPKSPAVMPESPPAPPVVPQPSPPASRSTVAPKPRPTTPRTAAPRARGQLPARNIQRSPTGRQAPGQAYRPAAPRSTLPPPRASQRTPVARSAPPTRSYQTPGRNQLPELPKALPYSPGRGGTESNRTKQPVNLDKNGYVTARVPVPSRSFPTRSRPSRSSRAEVDTLTPAMGTNGTLPPAEALRPSSPIEGFIMESFARDSHGPRPSVQQPLRVRPRMPQAPPPQPPNRQYQDPSLVGRIRDTFSRFNPFQ